MKSPWQYEFLRGSNERHGSLYLMYHELEHPPRPLCQSEPGYVRYVVTEADFRRQMQSLQNAGIGGMSVPEALTFGKVGVAITFDDGCETDLLVAAPILKDAKFGATFYVTVGFMGKPGYLSEAQLRELSNQGFDIGCHSMTHAYLSDLDLDELRQEVAEPKDRLEQILGVPVQHFSCPGGRWNAKVAKVACESGYRSVATSRNSANGTRTNPFRLGRVAIMRGTALATFQRVCHGEGLWRLQLAYLTRVLAKKLVWQLGLRSDPCRAVGSR
jgi:peptidoglycan/xylan/chitin deacetylase (PgdA/CDA1 family)